MSISGNMKQEADKVLGTMKFHDKMVRGKEKADL
tara:strand:+ start:619 stop:720 length:102 start_codon:yes stop_codon:yes gene_type:complete